jgi:DNA-binding transcriptional regulator YiaG
MEPHEIKALRERLGVSQAGLARLMTDLDGRKVSRRTVEQWEQDIRGVGPDNLKKLKRLEASREGDAIHAMLPNVRGKR